VGAGIAAVALAGALAQGAAVRTKPAEEVSPAAKKSRAAKTPAPDADVTETDGLPREAVVAALCGDRDRLRQVYAQAYQREQAGQDNRPVRTSEAIMYLFNNSLEDREQFLVGHEIAAAQARTQELRTLMLMSVLTAVLYELNEVDDQIRFNKFTRVFNRTASSNSQLVMLQPQAAVQLIWDGIYSVRQAKPATDRERKMVYLSTNFLRKYPNAPEAPEVQQFLDGLRAKLNADRAKRGKETGKIALKKRQYEMAEYHLEKSAVLAPQDAETSQLLAQARVLRRRAEEAEGLSLTVGGGEQQMSDADASVLAQACRALAAGDGAGLSRVGGQQSGVRDSIAVAAAALAEAGGRHDAALQQLASLAQQAPNTPGGRAAMSALSNTDYNLDEQFQVAVKELTAARRKFYLTGNRNAEDSTYQVGSAVIQQGGGAVTGLPVLAGADALVRGVTEQFRTSLNVDPVIDAGARYLRKYPKSQQAQAIAGQLAELAKKSGDFTRSEEYLAEAGNATPEQLAKLRDKQAAKLFEQAQQTGDLVERRRLLQELAQKFPESKVVQKSVGGELAKIAPGLAADSVVLPRKMLMKEPAVAAQLGLQPQLVDGDRGNGELSEEGLTIHPAAHAFEYKYSGVQQWRAAGLPAQGAEQLVARARQLQRDYNTLLQGKSVVQQQKVPFAVDGGVGSSGVDLAPQLVPAKADPRDKERFK
jgi:hypothetical protein